MSTELRPIRFRAKRKDDGDWVDGNLLLGEQSVGGYNVAFIAVPFANDCEVVKYEVDPATIGQFTGLTDKNGNKIWENETRQFYDWGGDGRKIGVATVVWDIDEMGWYIKPNLGIEDRYDLRKALIISEIAPK